MGTFSASIEVGGDGWCTAWVPELPGVFLNDPSEKSALRDLPETILAYLRWLRRHGERIGLPSAVFVDVVEHHVVAEPMRWGNYEVLHRFERSPLTRAEITRALRWMRFMRTDTLRLVALLPPGGLNWTAPRQKRTINEHLHHIAEGEQWYLNRLALGPPPDRRAQADPLEHISRVRREVEERLLSLTSKQRAWIVKADNDRWWSARKMLGRFLYHERYHIRSMARIARYHRVRVPGGLGGWVHYRAARMQAPHSL